MKVRSATEQDVAAIADVYTRAVHEIAARSYGPAQRLAWAPKPPDLQQWRARLAPLMTFVADFGGAIGGFIAFDDQGHIQLLFTSPDHARQGVASRLFEEMLVVLRGRGIRELSTEASHEARPFFERWGLRVVEAQTVQRNGERLRRFAMTGPMVEPAPADLPARPREADPSRPWFVRNLGDAMLAHESLDRIQALFASVYGDDPGPSDRAVFIRHESEGRLHCEVIAYFSPGAEDVAWIVGAVPCGPPASEGLDVLVGCAPSEETANG